MKERKKGQKLQQRRIFNIIQQQRDRRFTLPILSFVERSLNPFKSQTKPSWFSLLQLHSAPSIILGAVFLIPLTQPDPTGCLPPRPPPLKRSQCAGP